MKQAEFIKVICETADLQEEAAQKVWEGICEKMGEALANGHGFVIPHVGRMYVHNIRGTEERISFVHYMPSKELLAKLNRIEGS